MNDLNGGDGADTAEADGRIIYPEYAATDNAEGRDYYDYEE